MNFLNNLFLARDTESVAIQDVPYEMLAWYYQLLIIGGCILIIFLIFILRRRLKGLKNSRTTNKK